MCAWAHRLASYALTGGSRFLSLAYSCTLNSPVFPFAKHPIIQSLRLVRFIFLLPFLPSEAWIALRACQSQLFAWRTGKKIPCIGAYVYVWPFSPLCKATKNKTTAMGRASLFFLWSMRPEANLCASLLDDLVPLHSTTSTRFYSVWAVHSSLQCASLYLPTLSGLLPDAAVWNNRHAPPVCLSIFASNNQSYTFFKKIIQTCMLVSIWTYTKRNLFIYDEVFMTF